MPEGHAKWSVGGRTLVMDVIWIPFSWRWSSSPCGVVSLARKGYTPWKSSARKGYTPWKTSSTTNRWRSSWTSEYWQPIYELLQASSSWVPAMGTTHRRVTDYNLCCGYHNINLRSRSTRLVVAVAYLEGGGSIRSCPPVGLFVFDFFLRIFRFARLHGYGTWVTRLGPPHCPPPILYTPLDRCITESI